MCRHQWQVLCQPQIARAPSFLPRLPATSFLPPSCLSPPALAYHSIPPSPLHICNFHIFAHIWYTKMCKITKALPFLAQIAKTTSFLPLSCPHLSPPLALAWQPLSLHPSQLPPAVRAASQSIAQTPQSRLACLPLWQLQSLLANLLDHMLIRFIGTIWNISRFISTLWSIVLHAFSRNHFGTHSPST